MGFPGTDTQLDKLGKTADPNKLKEQERKFKSLEAQQDDDLFLIMSSRQGRRWLWDLMEFCNIDGLSFVERNHDTTCFNEGKRNVGLRVKARIFRVDPASYLLMCKEAKQQEETNG